MQRGTGRTNARGSAFQEGRIACAKALGVGGFKKDEGGEWQAYDEPRGRWDQRGHKGP